MEQIKFRLVPSPIAYPEFIQIRLPATPANPTAINAIDDDDQNTKGKVPDELA